MLALMTRTFGTLFPVKKEQFKKLPIPLWTMLSLRVALPTSRGKTGGREPLLFVLPQGVGTATRRLDNAGCQESMDRNNGQLIERNNLKLDVPTLNTSMKAAIRSRSILYFLQLYCMATLSPLPPPLKSHITLDLRLEGF